MGNEMIQQFFHQYSPLQLPFETQYRLAFCVSLFVFLMAAFIRETVKSPGWRWMARFAGAAAFFAIAGYGKYTTEEIKELSNELHVKRGSNASQIEAVATEIADPVCIVAVASEYETTTAEGSKISIIKYSDGRVRPVFHTLGLGSLDAVGNSRASDGNRGKGDPLGGSSGRSGSLRSAEPLVSF